MQATTMDPPRERVPLSQAHRLVISAIGPELINLKSELGITPVTQQALKQALTPPRAAAPRAGLHWCGYHDAVREGSGDGDREPRIQRR